MSKQLRFYTLINFYLSSIQQGIQSAHLAHVIFNDYAKKKLESVPDNRSIDSEFTDAILYNAAYEMLRLWSEQHKTIIVLNGGVNSDLHAAYDFIKENNKKFSFNMPFTKFHEDKQSLDGILTGVGIVVPEELFDAEFPHRLKKPVTDPDSIVLLEEMKIDPWLRTHYVWVNEGKIDRTYYPETPDGKLIMMLKSCQLAR